MNNRNERRFLRLFLPFLLVPGLAASSAFGAPVRRRTAMPDQALLATAALNVEAYDRCQDGTIDLSGAREGTAAQAAKFRKFAEPQAQNELVLHQACLAAIPGQERSCEVLRGVKGIEKACREHVSYASLVAAIAGGGDARAVCAAFSMPGKTGSRAGGSPEKHAQKCNFLIAALRRGSSDVCGEAYNARIIPEEALIQCRRKLIYFDGVPDHCASDPDKVDEALCREKAALLAGLRTKDFRTCALSPWCRAATSHKAEACDPYLVQADKLFCDQVAKVAVPLNTAKAARDAKIQAMAAKQKKRFKPNEPMQVMDPGKLLKKPDESQGQ